MVSVGRQEHILQAETGQHRAVFKAWRVWQSVESVADPVPKGDQERANQENNKGGGDIQ